MIGSEGALTAGGTGALIVAFVYVGRLVLDWWKENHRRPSPQALKVDTAATANAVLVQTVNTLQSENSRLVERVRQLEESEAAKDRKIDELERRVHEIAIEVAKLHSGPSGGSG